jgi:molecular chaperone GrpE
MRPDEERQGPVIRDLRRIDPATGQVRESGSESGPQRGPAPSGGHQRPGRHSVSTPSGPTGRPSGGPAAGRDARGTGAAGPAGGTTNGGPAGGAPANGGGTGRGASSSGPAGDASSPVGGDASSPADGTDAATAQAMALLAERTADLQRLQAEYANYRKRVERDRLAVREQALANVLNLLLPVLDDIGRAREHGELTGGFKSVAESLEAVVVKLGLTAFGDDGDPFDPTLHEALMHSYSPDVTEPTAVKVLQPGYRVGERIIRPARVAVAEPVAQGEQDQADDAASAAATGDAPAAATNGASTSKENADGAGTGDGTADGE